MMRELHSQGKTIEEIAECLKTAPLDPHVISAIKTAHSLGYFFFLLLNFDLVAIIY